MLCPLMFLQLRGIPVLSEGEAVLAVLGCGSQPGTLARAGPRGHGGRSSVDAPLADTGPSPSRLRSMQPGPG